MRLWLSTSLPPLVIIFLSFPLVAQVATVTIENLKPGQKIPADYQGFGIELKDGSHRFLGNAKQPNTVFYQFMKNLGSGTIRGGGNSQDDECWVEKESAPVPAGCFEAQTPDEVKAYYAAGAATGWKVLMGINLAQNSPKWAMKSVLEGIVANSTPEQRLGVEIGNEPDRYPTRKFRDKNENGPKIRDRKYSPKDHVRDFLEYVKELKSNPESASIPVAGPTYSGGRTPQSDTGWRDKNLGEFIDGVGKGNLNLVTIHAYATSKNNYFGHDANIEDILSQDMIESWANKVKAAVSTAKSHGLDVQMTETNSVNLRGASGVSDSMASALWGLDWMFEFARVGMRRINFQTGARTGFYNAIQTESTRSGGVTTYANTAQPLYYAMYLFSNATNKSFLPSSVKTKANIKAYAVTECASCPVLVFLLNKDLKESGEVVVKAPSRMGNGSMLVLKAPALESREDQVTYGGQRFDNSTGKIAAPEFTPIKPDGDGNFKIPLDKASVVMLKIDAGNAK